MRKHTPQYARSEYHIQLAKMSFDKIFDLPAGVHFYFYNIVNNISCSCLPADPTANHIIVERYAMSNQSKRDTVAVVIAVSNPVRETMPPYPYEYWYYWQHLIPGLKLKAGYSSTQRLVPCFFYTAVLVLTRFGKGGRGSCRKGPRRIDAGGGSSCQQQQQ